MLWIDDCQMSWEVVITVSKPTDAISSAAATAGSMPFFKLGNEKTEAMLGMQKELLNAYEQISRAWHALKSETDLWSDLATKLTSTRSVPEALAAHQECVAQRMRMVAERWTTIVR
jgi:hypothetical protein